jgi:MFS family permease
LALLCTGQAAAWATMFLAVFLGPFAIQEMTGSFALGGLPFAMYYLSNLLVVLPAGRLMDRRGRAVVLALGHTVGGGGALAVALGLAGRASDQPWAVGVFLLGLFLLSAGTSIAFLTRVAAADLYPQEERGRGVGRVLSASFAGSVLGASAFLALALQGPITVATGYTLMLPFFGLGIAAMAALGRHLPRLSAEARVPRPPLRSLVTRRGVPWTIASNAGAQGGMGGIMSFASAALAPLGGPATGAIMLGHFGGMFLPSPLAGRVADRRGRSLAILCGGVVLGTGALLLLRADLAWVAGVGLVFVGAGWCLTYIPGTAVLADATGLVERGTLFGANDAIVSIFGGAVTLLAGFVFTSWGVVGLGALGALCGLLPIGAGLQRRGLSMPVPAGQRG